MIHILHIDTDKITLVIDLCIFIHIYMNKYTNPCVFLHDENHSLLTGCFMQILDTKREIFSTYVTFNAEFDGVVQICNFLCAYVIKI